MCESLAAARAFRLSAMVSGKKNTVRMVEMMPHAKPTKRATSGVVPWPFKFMSAPLNNGPTACAGYCMDVVMKYRVVL